MLLHKLIIIGDIIYIIVRDSWINVESQIKLLMFVLSHLFKNSNDIHTHKSWIHSFTRILITLMRKTVNQTVIMCSELSRNLKTEKDGCHNCTVILPAELKETLLHQQNNRAVRACPLGFHSFAHPSRRWGSTRGTSCPKHRSKLPEKTAFCGPRHLDSGDGWNDGYEQYKL